MKRAALYFFWFLLVGIALSMADSVRPYDSTDDETAGVRSGLILFVDNLTGCQYLKGGFFGGVTPRVDGNGSQIGCR